MRRALLAVVIVLAALVLAGCRSDDPNVQACTDWVNAQNTFTAERTDASFQAANDALDAAIDKSSGDVKRNLEIGSGG